MEQPLVNKIAQSGLITLDLETLVAPVDVVGFDLKDFLFQGLVLREKAFREALKQHDWAQYLDKVLAVYCSADAIIPSWAYMLVASNALSTTREVFEGTPDSFRAQLLINSIESMHIEPYKDARVIIKGCSKDEVPTAAYVAIVKRLQPHVRSLMFGEPCSTVPVFKAPKQHIK